MIEEIHISFGGGGAKIYFHAGVMSVVKDLNIGSVSGTSSGALAAFMLAMSKPNQFIHMVMNTPKDGIVGKNINVLNTALALAFKKKSISNLDPLYNLIQRHIKGSMDLPCYVGTIDMDRKKEKIIKLNGESNRVKSKAILASCSIPAVWPVVNGKADGGARSNIPVNQAIRDREADGVIIKKAIYVLTQPKELKPENRKYANNEYNLIEAAKDLLENVLHQVMIDDINSLETVNKFTKDGPVTLDKTYRYIEPVGIYPEEPLGSMFDFDKSPEERLEMFNLGKQAAEKILQYE